LIGHCHGPPVFGLVGPWPAQGPLKPVWLGTKRWVCLMKTAWPSENQTQPCRHTLASCKSRQAIHLVSSSFLGLSGFMRTRHQRLFCISRATASASSITAIA